MRREIGLVGRVGRSGGGCLGARLFQGSPFEPEESSNDDGTARGAGRGRRGAFEAASLYLSDFLVRGRFFLLWRRRDAQRTRC